MTWANQIHPNYPRLKIKTNSFAPFFVIQLAKQTGLRKPFGLSFSIGYATSKTDPFLNREMITANQLTFGFNARIYFKTSPNVKFLPTISLLWYNKHDDAEAYYSDIHGFEPALNFSLPFVMDPSKTNSVLLRIGPSARISEGDDVYSVNCGIIVSFDR